MDVKTVSTQINIPEVRTVRTDQVKMIVGPKGRLPTRGTEGAIGYDLYAAEGTEIPAGGWKSIPTDIRMEIPKGSYGRIASRSGNTLRHGLTVQAGVIDPDYRGDIGVILFNLSKESHRIVPGMRIAQIIFE